MNYENSKLISQMVRAQNTRCPFECRIDPRNVGTLYYLDGTTLERIPLNTRKTGMEEWEGISLSEYRSLRAAKLENDRSGEQKNLQLDIALHDRQENIVREASKHKKANSVKGMRKSRKHEKQHAALEHSIVPSEENVSLPLQNLPVTEAEPEEIAETLEEAIRMFEEDEDARYD